MSDFQRIPIGFDTKGCMEAMKRVIEAYMSRLDDIFVELFKQQIDANGHGSKYMKTDAKRVIREIRREVTDDFIESQVGFDEAYARSIATDFYVRVMVVLKGNQGQGKLYSKPGQKTWKKHVTNYSLSRAKTRYELPEGFNQEGDISGKIAENAVEEIEKYFKNTLIYLDQTFDENFFAMFVTGG